MKTIILLLTVSLGISSAAFAGEPGQASTPMPRQNRQEMKKQVRDQIKEKREAVHAKVMEACGPEMQQAGCAGKTGGDMMKCMRTYKEAHPDFKPSEACREAHGEQREMRKEVNQMRKEMRHKIHQGMGGGQPPASGTTPADQ